LENHRNDMCEEKGWNRGPEIRMRRKKRGPEEKREQGEREEGGCAVLSAGGGGGGGTKASTHRKRKWRPLSSTFRQLFLVPEKRS